MLPAKPLSRHLDATGFYHGLLVKIVYIVFFSETGLSDQLRLASDEFFNITLNFVEAWQKKGATA